MVKSFVERPYEATPQRDLIAAESNVARSRTDLRGSRRLRENVGAVYVARSFVTSVRRELSALRESPVNVAWRARDGLPPLSVPHSR